MMHGSKNTLRPTGDVSPLPRVVQLLEVTARTLWERAEAEGPFSGTYSAAQDLHLAADLAAGLTPPAEGHAGPSRRAVPGDTMAALTEAVSLLRSVPIESLPPGTSQLLVRLADLIRQANL